MIEGIDTVHVTDTALRRTATQLKDSCEVKGWVDKLPRMPSMAAYLSVTLRLGGGSSIVLQSYGVDLPWCEAEVFYLMNDLSNKGRLEELIPSEGRVLDITNALGEQE